MDQIADARELKKIDTVALYAHAPCGAAAMATVSIERTIMLQIRAKAKIQSRSPGIDAGCFFHVDYGNNKRTYFLSCKEWEVWAARHRNHAVSA